MLVHSSLSENALPLTHFLFLAYRFVLQLHDEMILETKETIADQVAEIVRRKMEHCYHLRVQLRVRLSVGKTWGELKCMQL